ncbi:MAG: peptidoglycan DD-metalloendopeptidase family protein [Bacteroidales bacterium]
MMGKKIFNSTSAIAVAVLTLIILAALVFLLSGRAEENPVAEEPSEQKQEKEIARDEFGFAKGSYRVEEGMVRRGQTLSHLLSRFDYGPADIDRIARRMQDVFSPRRIKGGNNYYGYYTQDTDTLSELCYFVYEISDLDYLVVDFCDSLDVYRGEKEVTNVSREASGIIRASLWNTIIENNLPQDLVIQMSRILAWTVDFYRIESGDRFKVLYEEAHVGERPVGVSRINAVYFMHRGSEIEGYHFAADTIDGYYDGEGNSLQKVFLRAPLEYVRISSRYSQSRMHPIHGDRRPHLGTDYAAPHGTPILAVGDGTVTQVSYTSGNGNYVKIRHNSVYQTQYLHMSRFASGISPGTRVEQGEVIGYVGSTGLATGPHVCFRFWQNGQQVDHLRLEFPSGDPLPGEYMDTFLRIRDSHRKKLDAVTFDEKNIPV